MVTIMSNSTNVSFDFCEDLPFFRPELSDNVPYLVTVILIFSTGCMGNVVTVVIISCWRKLHTPTFTMLACLAVSDAYSLISYMLILDTNVEGIIRCQCVKWRCNSNSYHISITFQILNRLGRFHCWYAVVYTGITSIYCNSLPSQVQDKLYLQVGDTNVFAWIGCHSYLCSCICYLSSKDCHKRVCSPHCVRCFTFYHTIFNFYCITYFKIKRNTFIPKSEWQCITENEHRITIVLSIYITSSASVMIINIIYCHMDGKIDMYWIFITKIFFLGNCAINPFIYFFSSPPIVQLFRNIWHILSFRCQSTYFWYIKLISTLI